MTFTIESLRYFKRSPLLGRAAFTCYPIKTRKLSEDSFFLQELEALDDARSAVRCDFRDRRDSISRDTVFTC